jgi:hypothetical protein
MINDSRITITTNQAKSLTTLQIDAARAGENDFGAEITRAREWAETASAEARDVFLAVNERLCASFKNEMKGARAEYNALRGSSGLPRRNAYENFAEAAARFLDMKAILDAVRTAS